MHKKCYQTNFYVVAPYLTMRLKVCLFTLKVTSGSHDFLKENKARTHNHTFCTKITRPNHRGMFFTRKLSFDKHSTGHVIPV